MTHHHPREDHSFFFPIFLITLGVIWLLVNQNVIPVEQILRLAPYWPLVLVFGGLSLIVGRIWWPLKALVWAAGGALVIWMALLPSNFLPQPREIQINHQVLQEKLGVERKASIDLDLAINPTKITAEDLDGQLMTADVYSSGEVYLTRSSSEGSKQVSLLQNNELDVMDWFENIGRFIEQGQKTWTIGLTPKIPLDLSVNTGTGSVRMELNGLQLDRLKVDSGTGAIWLQLPQQSDALPVTMKLGTGSGDVTIPDKTAVDLDVETGTGSLIIRVPETAGVQVEVVDAGIGNFHIPAGYQKVSGESDERTGVWENQAYADADYPIRIQLDLGTGGVQIRSLD